jgi:hypothetical protein
LAQGVPEHILQIEYQEQTLFLVRLPQLAVVGADTI